MRISSRIGAAIVAIVSLGVAAPAIHAETVDLIHGNTGTITGVPGGTARFDFMMQQPTGTGVIKPFLRVQASPFEQGYNTSGGTPFDDKPGPWTHDLLFSDLLQTAVNIDGVIYFKLLLDVNEPNGKKSLISLDQLQFYTSPIGSQTTTNVPMLGTLRFSFKPPVTGAASNDMVLMDAARNHGSGSGDMYAFIPAAAFAGTAPTDFVYMYVFFGAHDSADIFTGGGFEEWALVLNAQPSPTPTPTVTPTPSPTPPPTPTPTPTPTCTPRSISNAPNPVINNANFETGPFSMEGTVTGWTASAHVADISEGATSGTHSAGLSAGGDSQGDTLQQSFSTISGQTYALDFDAGIFGVHSGAPLQVQVEVLGSGSLVNQVITPPEAGTFVPSQVAFQHYHFTFTANTASTNLRFTSLGSGNGSADQVIDTVSVTAVQAGQDDVTECDALAAVADACFTLAPAPCFSGTALFLPNADCQIPYTDCTNPGNPAAGSDGFRYAFTPVGTFTENATNGTATLTGHLESQLHPGYGFDVSLTFTGRTNTPNGMGPDLGLDPGCYVPPFGSGGPVDPSTWHFYSFAGGTLTGTGNYAGAVLQLTWTMKFFQVGDQPQSGASGKNIRPGSSGWFTWSVQHQPNNPAFCLRGSAQTGTTADFNFNCENMRRPPVCPTPTPTPVPTIAPTATPTPTPTPTPGRKKH